MPIPTSPIPRLAVTCAALSLAACATRAPEPERPRSSPPVARSIAILPVVAPPAITIGTREGFLGLLGPLAIAANRADLQERSKGLAQAMRERDVHPDRMLRDGLARALADAGYAVRVLDGPKGPPDDPYFMDYARVQTDADLVLHVWITASDVFQYASSPVYRPRLDVAVKLLAADDLEADEGFVDQWILYGATATRDDDDEILADPRFEFADRTAVAGDPARVADAFREANRRVVERVLARMRAKRVCPGMPAGAGDC